MWRLAVATAVVRRGEARANGIVTLFVNRQETSLAVICREPLVHLPEYPARTLS
jgi:hypothetical protein